MPEEKQSADIRALFRKGTFSREIAPKGGIAVVLIAALAMMFPRGESIELDYKVGAIWAQKDLIAPFSFPIYRDEREYAADVEKAKAKVYPVFERDVQAAGELQQRYADLFRELQKGVTQRNMDKKGLKERRPGVISDSTLFLQQAFSLSIQLQDSEWDILARLETNGRLAEMQEVLTRLAGGYIRAGILNQNKDTLTGMQIAIRRGIMEEIVPKSQLYDMSEIASALGDDLISSFGSQSPTVTLMRKIGLSQIGPNLRFDKPATAQAESRAVDAVPRTLGYVQELERIVGKHDRIMPETKMKLESLRRARAERGSEANIIMQDVGIVLHVTIVVMLYGVYLFLFRKGIFSNNRRLALIALVILIEGVFAYVSRDLDVAAPVEYLIFLPAASMLLTIIFDSRAAFYGTVIMAYLVAGIRGNDYSVALASLVAGALSVYTVRDIKNRSQIFRSLGFIFLGYGLTIIAMALERFEALDVVLRQLMFAGVNAVISPVLTFGLLIFFERFFRVTTDLTLIELGHFNHPLLRLLAERAPGTYHHSMTMASLAEAAAAAVGANEILARVGAYFHDIGKIEKPPYFVENQKGSRNRHDKLSPRMSSLIIAAHVKDGIALAQEYDLPQEVIDFIPMHHGTTRIDYFYNKAVKLAESSADETKIDEIKEQDYRYPGPKPQTKETGILMLADAIEATARTLDDPSPPKLELTIDELVKKRFGEGELDDCPLTLKDLTKIKAAFLNVLVGIYHSRIKYPEMKKRKPPKVALQPPSEEVSIGERIPQTVKEINKE